MGQRQHRLCLIVAAGALVLGGSPRADRVLAATASSVAALRSGDQKARVNPDAKALATFQERVKQYVALHRRLEETLPSLPKDATPQQIDSHQRELGQLIREARATAQPGDIFVREARAVIRRLLIGMFSGPDGRELKNSIKDENPGEIVKLRVNDRYPDVVPISTVPAKIIAALPKLPQELEYRFVANDLILFDVPAHIIVDLIPKALP